MSFSLRLTADLILASAARAIGAKRGCPLILQLSTNSLFDTAPPLRSAGGPEIGNDSSLRLPVMVPQFRSPIIWIAGPEPLEHPQVARFANAVAASGRHVFLETSGASLKRYLHEFQPSSHFYFVVRFDGLDASREPRDAALRTGLEALRMARLAGFFTCARLVVRPDMAVGELERLHGEIRKLDVDGILITPAAAVPEFEKQADLLRRRLLNRRCALLSSLLDSGARCVTSRNSVDREPPPLPESQRDSFGEGAEAR